eukprot:s3838_g3.t1
MFSQQSDSATQHGKGAPTATTLHAIRTSLRPWKTQRIRCLMSVSVDIPGHGQFDIPLAASSTAADIILLLRERLPDTPWHGNKLLSSGVSQLQRDDVVEATGHSSVVFTNYSEITNQERRLHFWSLFSGYSVE